MIAAILRVDGIEVEPSLPDRMLGVWRPVAPYANGTWVHGAVAIGDARARLTAEPHPALLPMHDEQRDLVLAWDGRLDNREDLMTVLGCRQSSEALIDEALVIDAYARWGVAFVERLLGDFALILWDGRERRMLAAKDQIGVRPLHYAFDGRSLVIASRIGQVLEGAHLDRRLNEPMVADFLADNLNNLDETLFRDVKRVPQAHVLQHDRGAYAPRVWRYWDLRERPPIIYRSDGEYVEHFREVARTAIRSRMRGLHPVGVLLSGGYDSSTIACMASELLGDHQSSNGHVATFTAMSHDRPDEDERRYVDALVAHRGLKSYYVDADDMWTFKKCAPDASPWDEPFEGPFDGLITGLLDRTRQEGVRILLDGLGGDMLFTGTRYYLFDLLLERRAGRLKRELKHWPLSDWPALVGSYVLAPLFKRCPPYNAAKAPDWMRPEFAARCETDQRLRAVYPPHRFRRPSQQQTYEALTYVALPNTLLWLQSAALVHEIDMRHPLLDVRMIDFFMRIPSSQKAEGRSSKPFISRAMKDSFPPLVIDQSLAVGKYLEPLLKRGLLERWETHLGGPCHVAQLGYVDPDLLRSAFVRHLDCEHSYFHARKLARVLRLERWLRYLFGDPD